MKHFSGVFPKYLGGIFFTITLLIVANNSCAPSWYDTSWKNTGYSVADAEPWYDAGFGPNGAKLWHDAGFAPNDAKQWQYAGWFPPDYAKPWHDAGFAPNDARQWKDAGWTPADAKQWKNAGWTPADAKPWHDAGFGPNEVKPWHDAGFAPNDARQWKDAGWTPADAKQWKNAGFPLDVATNWLKAGVSTPDEGREWADAGFTVEEVQKYKKAGIPFTTALQMRQMETEKAWKQAGFNSSKAKSWQEAGFSLDDAISWAKSGFSPKEAKIWSDAYLQVDDHGILRKLILKEAGWLGVGISPDEAIMLKRSGCKATKLWLGAPCYHEYNIGDCVLWKLPASALALYQKLSNNSGLFSILRTIKNCESQEFLLEVDPHLLQSLSVPPYAYYYEGYTKVIGTFSFPSEGGGYRWVYKLKALRKQGN